MFEKENLNHTSKRAKTITNNNFLNDYLLKNHEIVNQIYHKSITLTNNVNNAILNQNKIKIEKNEQVLLLSDVIEKNSFNIEKRFAVLTNLRLLIYYSKKIYLSDIQKPNEIFKLIDYSFENEYTFLLIKKKENNNNEIKYITVKVYEFPNLKISKKWCELINYSLKNIENNNKYITYSCNNILFDELSNFNKDYYSYNQNKVKYNNNSIKNIKEKNTEEYNKDNKGRNLIILNDNKNKQFNELTDSNSESDNIYIKEKSEENYDNIYSTISEIDSNKENKEVNEEIKENNIKDIFDKENNNDKNKIIDKKTKTNITKNQTLTSANTYEQFEEKNVKDKKEINTKPSFRCLLREEINKIENELFNNNNIKEEKNDKSLENKNIVLLPMVENNIRNIYSFGKQEKLNSFHLKNNNVENNINMIKEEQNSYNSKNSNNEIIDNSNKNNNVYPENENESEDYTENDDIKIEDLSKNDISQNDMFKDNKSYMNDNISKISNKDINLKNSEITNKDRSSYNLINLINCEKESKSKSSIFDLSSSNTKNSKIENIKQSVAKINEFLKNYTQRNEIRSSFLNINSNEQQNSDKFYINNDDKNENIIYFSKSSNSILNNKEEHENKNKKNSIKSNIYDDNTHLNELNRESKESNTLSNEFNEINNIKMFDTPPKININENDKYDEHNHSKINTSIFNSPRINNSDESNNKEGKKIFIFSNESNNSQINSNENNKYSSNKKIYSMNPYSPIMSNNNSNKDNLYENYENECSYDFPNNISEININNDNNQNYIKKKYNNNNEHFIIKKNSNKSIIIIDKNAPILIKSSNYENIKNNNKIENMPNFNNEKTIINKSKIHQNKNKICIEKEVVNFNVIDKKNNKLNVAKLFKHKLNVISTQKNNKSKIFHNILMDNQENFHLVGNKKLYKKEAKPKINTYKRNHFEFQYSSYNLKSYKNNNFINIKLLTKLKIQKIVTFYIENMKKNNNVNNLEICQKTIQEKLKNENKDNKININNVFIKNNKECKNKSLDKIRQKKNIKYNKFININKEKKTYKNIYQMKLNKVKNNLSSENIKIYPNNSSKDSEYTYNDEEIFKDNSFLINNNDNDNNNKKCIITGDYNTKMNEYKYVEKSSNIIENNNKEIKNYSIQDNLIENILDYRYCKEMLLYSYNEGMLTTTFIPIFKENLEKLFNNYKNAEILLKYLFKNMPKLIRKRLQNKDLKILFPKNNCNNFNKESFYKSDNSEDEYNFAKEEIKKLIINDIKYVMKILNNYYHNISNVDSKNRLYKYKIIFVHEMKNLNSDIILS